jgi:N-acyl-D-aspartate/D-glutamate deacylase
MFDVVIRGGDVIDGTGAPRRTADVAIRDGRIAEIGTVGPGRRTIDAAGALVTPGFIDIHTHYDAQVMWDDALAPSSWHGVTTAVMGNCGVGFAPVAPAATGRLVELMEAVEDIPAPVLQAGVPFTWEGFEQYLDVVAARPRAIDLGAQLPHSALRLYVMGERGADGETAPDDDELVDLTRLVRRALEAGALGVSTARTGVHKTRDGRLLPTHAAGDAELMAIADGMRRAGRGVFEVASDRSGTEVELDLLRRFAERARRPVSLPLVQSFARPDEWRWVLDRVEAMQADGVLLSTQVAVRPVGQLLSFESSAHPFSTCPSFQALLRQPFEERVARLRRPDMRAVLVAEADTPLLRERCTRMFPFGEPVDYEPDPSTSIAAQAAARGLDAVELAYDRMLEDGGRARLYQPSQNFADGTADAIRGMLASPATVPGLGDAGAHNTQICDVSFPTSLLVHWGRDRRRGVLFPLEYLVAKQTSATARLYGLGDRGVLAPGMRADVNVIDWDRLRLRAPTMRRDFPAGGQRLVQRAEGYLCTLVAGEVTREHDEDTGARPGRLVRSAS